MKFAQRDNNGIYLGMVDAVEAIPPDVGFYAPTGITISALGQPPADEPGMWRDNGTEWVEVALEEARAATSARIDAETSAAITAGFDYEVNGQTLHFSYDANDQQNFADTANAAALALAGVPGVPSSVTWNGWDIARDENGKAVSRSLVRLAFSPESFLALYVAGALAHKAERMEEGGRRKARAMLAESFEELGAI